VLINLEEGGWVTYVIYYRERVGVNPEGGWVKRVIN